VRGVRGGLLALALLAPNLGARQTPDPSYLRGLVERLDAAAEDARRNAAATLRAEGEAAVGALLEGFEQASVRSRRARARLLSEARASGVLAEALARIDDPDAEVRGEWARLFARRDLPRDTIGVRVSALSRFALDPEETLRRRALEGLRSLDDPVAGRALADLARDPDLAIREFALLEVARTPSARPWIPEIARSLERDVPRYFLQVLLPLGRAVAVLDAGGDEEAVEETLALLARNWRHPDATIAFFSRGAFGEWIEGLNARGLADRATSRIEDLMRRTGDPPVARDVLGPRDGNLHRFGLGLLGERLADHHLFETRDLARARAAARALEERGRRTGGLAGMRWRSRGLAVEATCDLLLGDGAGAEEGFRRAADLLSRALEQEVEDGLSMPVGAVLETLDLVRVRMLRSMNALLHPGEEPRDPSPLDARAEFQRAWEAMASISREARFDEALQRGLGAERVAREALLAQCGAEPVSRVLRTFAGWLHELSPEEFLSLEEESPASRRRASTGRVLVRLNSFPLRVADFEASQLGRGIEALPLLDRLAAELRLSSLTTDVVDLLAQIHLARGRLLLDLRRGDEADEALRTAIEILEEFDKRGDPLARRRLSGAYVTLAVNENVVRGNRAAAREHCRRALDLDDSDFTRVLYACYLARDGKREEALEELSRVPPGPETYYNAACTYSLLGETGAALESLRRDFEERGAIGVPLDSHREWAWKDPDLRSIRSEALFREIVGPEPAPGQ